MDYGNQTSIRRKLLSEDVVEYLSDAIFRGDFKPGDKLIEMKIARLLDVSQGSVREALQIMKVRGFLESIPFRGTFVRQFTNQGLKDYFKTRIELEMIAACWSSELPDDPENTAYLQECVSQMESYRESRDKIQARRADLNFHRAIVKRSKSDSLLAAWEALNHSFWFSYGIHLEEKCYMVLDRQAALHRILLELLGHGRTDELRKQLEEHFINPNSVLRES